MTTRKLLRVDLVALRNVVRLREARPALWGALTGYFFLGFGGLVAGGRLIASEPVTAAIAKAPEIVVPALLSMAVFVPLMFALSFTVMEVQQVLFGPASAGLLMASPVRRYAIVTRAWVRVMWTACSVLCVLAMPAMLGLVKNADGSIAGALLYPVVGTAMVAPFAALVTLFRIVQRGFAGGPRARLVINIVGAGIGLVLVLLFGAGLIARRSTEQDVARRLQLMDSVPEWFEAPGRLLGWAFGWVELTPVIWFVPLMPLLVLPLLWGAAVIYPSAWQRDQTRSTPRTRGRRVRTWPTTPRASVMRKDLVATFQVRANFAGFALFGAVAALFAQSDLASVRLQAEAAPAELGMLLGLATAWAIIVMMLATLQGGGFFTDEVKQFDLLAVSPVPRRDFIHGKLPAILMPYVWVLLVVVITALFVRDANAVVLAGFLMAAVPMAMVSLGIVLAAGTMPALNRSREEPGQQTGRVLIIAAMLTAPGIATIMVLHEIRAVLYHHYATPGSQVSLPMFGLACYAGIWFLGAISLIAGRRAAGRNVERLLGPVD